MKMFRGIGFISILALMMLAGCANKSFKEGSQAAEGIQKVEQEARAGSVRVDATIAALDDMFNNQQGDLKMQFKTFSKSIDSLEAQGERVKKRADTMASKKTDYLLQWDQQMATIKNDSVRQTSEQRRKSVEKMFSTVQHELDAAGESFRPFMDNLNDIRTAVNMDLTRSGLTAMRPVADKARNAGKMVNTRIDAAISALSNAATALAAAGG